MEEVHGIRESKEVLVALNELSMEIIKLVKDGLQWKDAVDLYSKLNNSDLLSKLTKAANGIDAVPDEVKDLNISEAMELAMVQIAYIPRIVDALKGEGEGEVEVQKDVAAPDEAGA